MKKRKAKHKNKNKMGFKVCILLGIMILFSVFLFKNNEDYTTVDLENVEALKISSSMVKNIKNLATKYEIDFSELFTAVLPFDFSEVFVPDCSASFSFCSAYSVIINIFLNSISMC